MKVSSGIYSTALSTQGEPSLIRYPQKYMATEGEEWDTSTALIRRVFKECIELGRKSEGKDGADLFEAFRLLGTGLHTLEDLMAHSNWCELGLRRMGHSEVFCHVGEDGMLDL